MRWKSSKRAVRAVAVCLALMAFAIGARCVGVGAPPAVAAQSLLIVDRNGAALRELLSPKETRQQWVDLSDVSPHLVHATIVAEDKRFFRHAGVDALALVRALVLDVRAGRVVSGGSTITQQLARLLFPRPRTIGAKLIETAHAQWLEIVLSKRAILEQYLNRTPYGNQLVGCEAAARMYFGKPARDLSVAEAAYLSVLPRAPSVFNPYHNPTRVVSRQHDIIERMLRAGFIASDERERALSEPVAIQARRYAFAAPHFVEMLPRTAPGGVLHTTLDSVIQERTERLVKAHLAGLVEHHVTNAAAVVVDNASGEILALVGSGDFFDEQTGGQVNGVTARRQPGSTLKPFTYALALESGYTAASILPDIPLSFPTPEGEYAPQNYDRRFRGPVRIRTALANSLNVPAVFVLSRLGVARLLGALHEMGFRSLDKPADYYGLGLTLGGGEVTLLELAGGYATLARGGVYLPLALIKGEVRPAGKRVFSREVSYIISDILADDEARRLSFGEDSPLDVGFAVAAKTGTSKNFRDNWTVGFTRDVTVAVWAGNFDAEPMRGVSGISGAGPLFRDIMTMLASRTKPAWIARSGNIAQRSICPLSGMRPGPHCPTDIDELFAGAPTSEERCAFHVELPVDLENELLASDDCPGATVERRAFVDLPRLYRDWAQKHRVHLAPARFSPRCTPPRQVISHHEERPRILHPHAGASYALDHMIPRRLQTLLLDADADVPLVWSVDGVNIGRTEGAHDLSWEIAPGRHTIAIATENGIRQDTVTITVAP